MNAPRDGACASQKSRARVLLESSQDCGLGARAKVRRAPCAQPFGKRVDQIVRDAPQCVRAKEQCLLLLVHRECADTSQWYRLSPSRGDRFRRKKQLTSLTLAPFSRHELDGAL